VTDKTVLVVDDEPDIRDSLRDVLEDEGYRVRLACNGVEALAELKTLPRPCAVILDIIMPLMSGTEFYAAMMADPRTADVPLVVSTSDPSRVPPGPPILKKPIDVTRLLAVLDKFF
jgi:CheY-like chemotaxis protein